jgi:hypothetical protein
MSAKFFGKYRGVVTNNVDPMQMGRIRALVPDVSGTEESGFAMPSVPCHLPRKIASALPRIGAAVWIEFEQGDRRRPIWTGCFFRAAAETPPSLRNRK